MLERQKFYRRPEHKTLRGRSPLAPSVGPKDIIVKFLLFRIATVGCFLVCVAAAVLAQDQAPLNLTPFDRYGRITWDEERKRLDSFAEQLTKQPEMTGYIYIQEAQISGVNYAVGHAIDITQYVIKIHHIRWNRVAWRDLGFGEEFVTSLWLFPTGQPPFYSPPYKPPTDLTFIEGAPRSGRRRRHRWRRPTSTSTRQREHVWD